MTQVTDQPALRDEAPAPPAPAPAPPASPASPRHRRLKADVVGIDLVPDGRAVAVGLARRRGSVTGLFVHVAASAEQLARDLNDGRLQARRINLSLPAHKFITKRLKLPSSEAAEIASMLDFELHNLIPLSEGSNARAYVAWPAAEPGYTDVSAFVSPDSVVEAYVAPLASAGRLPDRIVAGPLALWAWAQLLTPQRTDSLLVLAADPWALEVVTVQDGRLDYCRTLSLDEEPAGSPAALQQALQVLAQDQSRFSGSAAPAHLVASPAVAAALPDQLRRLGLLAPDQPAGPLPGLPAAAAPYSCDGDLEAAVARAAGAAALEFLPEMAGFNLLLESQARLNRRASLRRHAAATGVLAALLTLMLAGGLAWDIHRGRVELADLQQQIAPIQNTAAEVARKRQQVLLLRSQLDLRGLSLAALGELYRIVPAGVSLIEVNLVGTEMTITAQAQSPEQAYAMPSMLMKSPLFHKVLFRGAFPVARGTSTVTEFGCSFQVAMPAPATRGAK